MVNIAKYVESDVALRFSWVAKGGHISKDVVEGSVFTGEGDIDQLSLKEFASGYVTVWGGESSEESFPKEEDRDEKGDVQKGDDKGSSWGSGVACSDAKDDGKDGVMFFALNLAKSGLMFTVKGDILGAE